ncbi:hypothetical protein [Pseudolactococcus reticulitermitis]|uniref:Uncharacterized protein n=1 Tax=Pseudolactococcus reticulitermitis TaxID=2025039 RepID=A0A224X0H2_9LACT|nr:hypothetical protein [Lactococcus reticulitermitis]GAX47749.1 hypothetical protein RsY01_1350 [Lactococcus reticulitermitis]
MRKLAKVFLCCTLFLGIGIGGTATIHANDDISKIGSSNDSGQPIVFENITDINDINVQIDSFYLRNANPFLRASAGTKWKEGESVSDGKVGYYTTSYFWVKGSDMVSWNIVGKAERNAVIAKYGSVNSNTSYKMKTTQHITLSGKWSYKTISANAWCYGKD